MPLVRQLEWLRERDDAEVGGRGSAEVVDVHSLPLVQDSPPDPDPSRSTTMVEWAGLVLPSAKPHLPSHAYFGIAPPVTDAMGPRQVMPRRLQTSL